MDANESNNTRLRSALGPIEAQRLLVHGLQRPRTQDFTELKGTYPRTRRRMGSSSSTFLEYICVHWHLFAAEFSPRSAYSIFSGGHSPSRASSLVMRSTWPRSFSSPRGGVDRYVSERGGVIRTVSKLHKVSEKPASTLGCSTPGVVPKKPHPLGFGVDSRPPASGRSRSGCHQRRWPCAAAPASDRQAPRDHADKWWH